MHLSSRNGEIF